MGWWRDAGRSDRMISPVRSRPGFNGPSSLGRRPSAVNIVTESVLDLHAVLTIPKATIFFQNYCKRTFVLESLEFIQAVLAMRLKYRQGLKAEAKADSLHILATFTGTNAEKEINVSHGALVYATSHAERGDRRAFDMCMKEVLSVMVMDIWPRYTTSPEYKEMQLLKEMRILGASNQQNNMHSPMNAQRGKAKSTPGSRWRLIFGRANPFHNFAYDEPILTTMSGTGTPRIMSLNGGLSFSNRGSFRTLHARLVGSAGNSPMNSRPGTPTPRGMLRGNKMHREPSFFSATDAPAVGGGVWANTKFGSGGKKATPKGGVSSSKKENKAPGGADKFYKPCENLPPTSNVSPVTAMSNVAVESVFAPCPRKDVRTPSCTTHTSLGMSGSTHLQASGHHKQNNNVDQVMVNVLVASN